MCENKWFSLGFDLTVFMRYNWHAGNTTYLKYTFGWVLPYVYIHKNIITNCRYHIMNIIKLTITDFALTPLFVCPSHRSLPISSIGNYRSAFYDFRISQFHLNEIMEQLLFFLFVFFVSKIIFRIIDVVAYINSSEWFYSIVWIFHNCPVY